MQNNKGIEGIKMIKVLFVCMGNICRSPSAQGVFEALVKERNIAKYFEVDSAGTHAYHIGNPPDKRSQLAAQKKGIDLSQQRARIVQANDFYHYDYIVAMDADNFTDLKRDCPLECQHKLYRLLEFVPNSAAVSVPDPYFLGNFDTVFDLVKNAGEQLLDFILKNVPTQDQTSG